MRKSVDYSTNYCQQVLTHAKSQLTNCLYTNIKHFVYIFWVSFGVPSGSTAGQNGIVPWQCRPRGDWTSLRRLPRSIGPTIQGRGSFGSSRAGCGWRAAEAAELHSHAGAWEREGRRSRTPKVSLAASTTRSTTVTIAV